MALGYRMDDLGFESQHVLGIFLFSSLSRPDLVFTQPSIQRVQGTLSP
jgi:hypothetical protein